MNGSGDSSKRGVRGERHGREDAVVGRVGLRARVHRRELVEVAGDQLDQRRHHAARWRRGDAPPRRLRGRVGRRHAGTARNADRRRPGAVWTMNGSGDSSQRGVRGEWHGREVAVVGRVGLRARVHRRELVEVAGDQLDQRRHHAARWHRDAAPAAASRSRRPTARWCRRHPQIVDALGAVWTMNGAVVLRNGLSAAGGSGFRILCLRATVYVLGSDNARWWRWTGSGWTYYGTAQPG